MTCVYPNCGGELRFAQRSGSCGRCFRPVWGCAVCGAANRAHAALCRICGNCLPELPVSTPLEPAVLLREPAGTALSQPLATAPEPAEGYLWAVTEQGDLLRLNPFAPAGGQVEARTRLWAGRPPHAFAVRRLLREDGPGAASGLLESCAIAATPESLQVISLATGRSRQFSPGQNAHLLTDARDQFQRIEAEGSRLFALAATADGPSLLCLDAHTGAAQCFRLEDAAGTVPHDNALCGPVLLPGSAGTPPALLVWSSSGFWTWVDGALTHHSLPAGTAVWTAPSASEAGLRFPLGSSPALVTEAGCYLPAKQFGAPALLFVRRLPSRWSLSVIPIRDSGTVSAGAGGRPLLATTGRLLVCAGEDLRTLLQDEQSTAQFAAWEGADSPRLFFCEANYGGRRQWVKAQIYGEERPVNWALSPGEQLRECAGWWQIGSALTALLLVQGRTLRTEFVAWRP